ncbi:MAG: N-acetylmuramoyl-L-alanine amidase [Clostridiales bacterium]|nr:N-acetylmuramoyl-L-alanine amidase [Clostridiales bacterium]
MPGDNLAQFKQILANLPEDRRKRLYDRLHAMPASQREAFINDFTRKYLSGQRKHPSKKTGTQTKGTQTGKKPSSPNGNVQKKAQPSNGQPQKKAQPANAQKKAAPANGQKKPSPSNNQPQKKHPSPAAKNIQGKQGSNVKKHPDQAKAAPVQKKEPAPQKAEHEQRAITPKKPVNKKPIPAPKKIEKLPVEAPQEIEPEHINVEPIRVVEEPKEPPRSKEASLQSVAIGVLMALLIIGFGYIIYLFNKQSIDRKFNQMFGMPAEETIATTPEGLGIIGSEPDFVPTDTPTPVPATPTPTPITLKEDHPDLKGKVIVIDPGHQEVPNTEKETAIKGSSAEKDKATSGAVGVDSGAKEYELTLQYALVLREYLEGCGAKVILTRDTNDADISNIERAKVATDSKADYFIRLHADSAPSGDISGVKVYVPSTGKFSKTAVKDGTKLAELVANEIGSTSLGVVQSNMYTGLNYADSVKSYQLVVGYLSNSNDDSLITNSETPYKVAVAISEFLR